MADGGEWSGRTLTFSWSMCLRSLISRRVLFASIRLSNAFAIFFIAISSSVSVLMAELQEHRSEFEILQQRT